MNDHVVRQCDVDVVREDPPPAGTAIVRPQQHVMAVRKRHLEQLAARSHGAESRSARAWSWALGETPVAPVTDRVTIVPPTKADIRAEIAVAGERALNGEREGRADGAATVLRWLIGDEDHLPVRGPDRGELVGGFGEVVRSPAEIEARLATVSSHNQVTRIAPDDSDYRAGVVATLRWLMSRQVSAPISGTLTPELTTRDLKLERLHGQDLTERHGKLDRQSPVDQLLIG